MTATPPILNEMLAGLQTEQAEVRWFQKNIGNYRYLFDIGANVGAYSLLADDLMRKGRIVAVEADPGVHAVLVANLASQAQHEAMNDRHAVHAAAAGAVGELIFYQASDAAESTVGSLSGQAGLGRPVRVIARTLDDLAAEFMPPVADGRVLVKVDVEGAEFQVIEGACRLLGRDDVDFLVEMHAWGDPSSRRFPTDVIRFFKSAGYRVSRVGTLFFFTLRKDVAFKSKYLRWLLLYHVKELPYRYLRFTVPWIKALKAYGLWARI